MHAHDWRVTRQEMVEQRHKAEQTRFARAARRAKRSAVEKPARSKAIRRPGQPVIVSVHRRVQHR